MKLPTDIREIPFNYTSADDHQIINFLLGESAWESLEELRAQRVTGRSAKLLLRFLGDIFIYTRNAYLYEELLVSGKRRGEFKRRVEMELMLIEKNASHNPLVITVINQCRILAQKFLGDLHKVNSRRNKLKRLLSPIIGQINIKWDPLTLISHATDATDWRLHLPFAVVYPTQESHVSNLIQTIANGGWKIIPRGSGTGLTGGAVPLTKECVIVSTEKLNHIGSIELKININDAGLPYTFNTLTLESGVVTEDAMKVAKQHGLVFATDPTSAWACTIGGNVAENAGGKSAVLWGTAIDNLVSFRMVSPQGELWIIERKQHPHHKIYPSDTVCFEVKSATGVLLKTINLKGSDIRKNGLWKDITNKVLGGVPGLQKEGTDGIITQAEFILYSPYEYKHTMCLEFYGETMDEASQVIVDITKAFAQQDEEVLLALEHFDDQYIEAINYRIKSQRADTPNAVLLIDIGGHNEYQLKNGLHCIETIIDGYANTELFVASSNEEAERFWQDRKRLGAIAARTNAFKLNEDIVLPLSQLAPFASFVKAINLRAERDSQTLCVRAFGQYLQDFTSHDDEEWYADKCSELVSQCNLAMKHLESAMHIALRKQTILLELKNSLTERLHIYPQVKTALENIYEQHRRNRLVVATHMHAGDGNVHVNIPVHSNNRVMMRAAEGIVDDIMTKVLELGGVISGEHGIGLTKLKYLDNVTIEELGSYRLKVDPLGVINPGKLFDRTILSQIFTPSFNILELEARILQRGSLKSLAMQISQCVRCGKCKPTCCVFSPKEDLFFHPRDKNLGIGAIIEALLYDAQREQVTSFELLKHLENIADHCTICHKCLKPCPVDIDTGIVSIMEREVLKQHRFKKSTLMTRLALSYLRSRSAIYNKLFRTVFMQIGCSTQALASRLTQICQRFPVIKHWYLFRILKSPMTPASYNTIHDDLPQSAPNQALVISPSGEVKSTVFYFPGCGSERQYGNIARATVFLLLENNIQVILPPPYLCCGYPFYTNTRGKDHAQITLQNSIILDQIQQMFSHINFEACIVTCGTCKEALESLAVEEIFKAPIRDIADYLLSKQTVVQQSPQQEIFYHTPCHDSMNGKGVQILKVLGYYKAITVPHCCSEGGTMALSRPDITSAMCQRKEDAIKALQSPLSNKIILTNCPSCLQGLGRQTSSHLRPVHIAEALAEQFGGKDWINNFRQQVAKAERITF